MAAALRNLSTAIRLRQKLERMRAQRKSKRVFKWRSVEDIWRALGAMPETEPVDKPLPDNVNSTS